APAAAREQHHRVDVELLGLRVLAAPVARVALQRADDAELVAVGAAALGLLGQLEHGREVAALERGLGGAQVAGQGAGLRAALVEVLAERAYVGVAGLLEPLGGEEVAEAPVVGDEEPVGGVAHEVLAEAVGALAGEAGVLGARDELALLEREQPAVERGRSEPGQGRDRAAPELAAEDAGWAQDATRRAWTMASTVSGIRDAPSAALRTSSSR